jgi:hypothetical protein
MRGKYAKASFNFDKQIDAFLVLAHRDHQRGTGQAGRSKGT